VRDGTSIDFSAPTIAPTAASDASMSTPAAA
jgi:hypothetical protein